MNLKELNESLKNLKSVLIEGTWAIPFTLNQAKKLAVLMKKPISSQQFMDKGYDLVGDDDLYDFFGELEGDGSGDDVRGAVLNTVEQWLDEYERKPENFGKQFDPKAVVLLKKLIKKYGY